MTILKEKRLLVIALVVVFMVALSTASVSAKSVSLTLYYGQKIAYSKALTGYSNVQITKGVTDLKYNYKTLKRKTWFVIESNKGGWHDDNKTLVAPGGTAPKIKNTKKEKANYRLELNPYGTSTTGCVAYGVLSSK